jgi:hypothetical protein
MCVVDPDEHSRIFNQWKRLERSLQAMDGRIHESADNPEQIPIITKEAQQAFENAKDLVKAAWDLLIGHLPEGRGVSAIPFHVHEISKCSSQVFDSLETAIPSIDMLDSEAAKLRSLRVKKSAMLLEHLVAMESGTRLGIQGSYRDLAAVYESTLQSMLDLCETPAERLARCQQFVQRIEDTLQEAEAASRDGHASPIDLRHLEIQLLDTEIRLLREQQ